MLYVVTFEPDRTYNVARCGTWRAENRACSRAMNLEDATKKAEELNGGNK